MRNVNLGHARSIKEVDAEIEIHGSRLMSDGAAGDEVGACLGVGADRVEGDVA